jgi:peptidoglycan/xylan/chitin deacetylase (PgdA/CDA1 family)
MIMAHSSKRMLKRLVVRSSMLRAMAKLSKWPVVILRYHSVQEERANYADSIGAGIIHSAAAFERQMSLISRGYHNVTLDDVLDFLCGERRLPKRCVAVTFDDGFEDNFRFALPILEKYGLRASFFITVNSVGNHSVPWFCRLNYAFANNKSKVLFRFDHGRGSDLFNPIESRKEFREAAIRCACLTEDEQSKALALIEKELGVKTELHKNNLMMNWDQIRQVRQRGHIVGSHTLTHPNLAYLKNPLILREMAESKRILEENLGEPIIHFSYPGAILEPHYSKETISLSEKIGYKTAVTSVLGAVCKEDNPLALRRVPAHTEDLEFCWSLEKAFLGRPT